VLFRQLESQASKNALSKKFLIRLKVRMNERMSLNSGVLKYLSEGTFENDYTLYKKTQMDFNDDEEEFPNENPQFETLFEDDGENCDSSEDSDTEDHTSPRPISIESLFEIPKQSVIKNHLVKLISRLYPNLDVETNSDKVQCEPAQPPKKRSFEEKINDAINSSQPSTVHATPPQSHLAKAVYQEMNLFQKSKQRGFYLEECYKALKTIKPTSVESERAFSVSGYLCTKVRNRFNSDTLSTLCFLRHLFRNKIAFKDTKTNE
jgi:hypothetical protein